MLEVVETNGLEFAVEDQYNFLSDEPAKQEKRLSILKDLTYDIVLLPFKAEAPSIAPVVAVSAAAAAAADAAIQTSDFSLTNSFLRRHF